MVTLGGGGGLAKGWGWWELFMGGAGEGWGEGGGVVGCLKGRHCYFADLHSGFF